MNKSDGRHLTKEQQEFARIRAVELLKTKEYSKEQIAQILGVSKEAVRKWEIKNRKGGIKALRTDNRGKGGKLKSLTGYQERAIKHHIDTKTPNELGLSYFLWSREAIQKLIQKRYGVKISLSAISNLMKNWNYTPQVPIKKSYRQNSEEVRKWLNEEYPKIHQKAKAEKAEIYWLDETGIQNNENKQRGYSIKGRTPEIRVPDYRIRTNLISIVANQGKLRFMIYKDNLSVTILIDFLERLIREAKRKIYVIMDNHSVHKSGEFNKWLSERAHLIEVYKLPSYSPELNPDERLNRHLKSTIFKNERARDQKGLNNLTRRAMRRIQRNANLIKSFFEDASVCYARAA